ncbi:MULTISPECIES: HNH endonuclease family protein [Curtobacterium]|uniref:HNH endonuclease family protein n=1 Tax=Curtobacterium flaccumfaciens TaxID=2035 RepID=UPI003EE71616
MTTRRRRRTGTASVLLVLALALAGYALHAAGLLPTDESSAATDTGSIATGGSPDDRGDQPSTGTDVAEPSRASRPGVDAASSLRTLATLPVKGKAPATSYDRTADFGTAWLDVDRNGCDTRDDVLARDLTHVVRQGPCRVLTGTLVSPYTGGTIAFVRGQTTSTEVQVDHVVALENAWRTGAQQLSQTAREALANDPLNLFAVDQHSNAQKRSGDAATWLPAAKGFRCTYVGHQVTVKAKYHLWVTPAERDAMVRVLDRC